MIRNSKLGGTDWIFGETPLKSEDLNDTFDAVGMGLKKATMELDTNSYVLGTNNPTYKFTLPNSNNIITHIHVIYNGEDDVNNNLSSDHQNVYMSDFIKINGVNILMPEIIQGYTNSRKITSYGTLKSRLYWRTYVGVEEYSVNQLFPISTEKSIITSYSDSTWGPQDSTVPLIMSSILPSNEYEITIDVRNLKSTGKNGGTGGTSTIQTTLTNIQISIYYIENIDNEINSNKFSIVT